MADDADLAAEYQDRHNAQALVKVQQAQPAAQRAAVAGKTRCAECNDKIPRPRVAALPFCTRCTECQEVFERRLKAQ